MKERGKDQETNLSYLDSNEGLIYRAMDDQTVEALSEDLSSLLDCFVFIYERNGHCFYSNPIPKWCSILWNQSENLNPTNTQHNQIRLKDEIRIESWKAAQAAIQSKSSVEDSKSEFLNYFSGPITSNSQTIGAIVIAYGQLPSDETHLKRISEKYSLNLEPVLEAEREPEPISPRLVQITKKRLRNIARQIGKTVEAWIAAELLKELEDRNQALLAYSPVCHKIIDLNSRLQYMNSMGFEMLKLEPSNHHFGHHYPFSFFPEDHKNKLEWAIAQVLKEGKKITFEGKACDAQGNPVWLMHNIIPVPKVDGTLNYLTVVSVDITEAKQSEQIIKDSLEEKEILLREVHHRVKNNMQVISGLIGMQSLQLNSPELEEPFDDIQNRIGAMASVHEILHNQESLSKIDLGEYIHRLCKMMREGHDLDHLIDFQIDIPMLKIDLEISYPIGLVVTELLSNALKYAFPPPSRGKIRILGKIGGDQLLLSLGDDGVGFPEDFDWENSDSMGLLIVRSLMEKQLGGNVKLLREDGTQWLLTIPLCRAK